MLENIRKRQAPKKHLYVERPAYIITETELGELEAELARLTARRSRYTEARYENCMEALSAAEAELTRLREELDETGECRMLCTPEAQDEIARLQQALADANEARRGIIAACIAVKGKLDAPYPDDNRWTPWQRFIEPALRRLDEALAGPDTPAAPMVFVWLVERGQSLNHAPTVWLCQEKPYGFSPDPLRAIRYPTREAAEAVIATHTVGARSPWAVAVEHGFMDTPACEHDWIWPANVVCAKCGISGGDTPADSRQITRGAREALADKRPPSDPVKGKT
jgi:hypothetical protein